MNADLRGWLGDADIRQWVAVELYFRCKHSVELIVGSHSQFKFVTDSAVSPS